MDVETFFSLYKGTMFKDLKFKSPECEGHCTRVEDLSRCPVECKNAVAREIMQAFSKCENNVKAWILNKMPQQFKYKALSPFK